MAPGGFPLQLQLAAARIENQDVKGVRSLAEQPVVGVERPRHCHGVITGSVYHVYTETNYGLVTPDHGEPKNRSKKLTSVLSGYQLVASFSCVVMSGACSLLFLSLPP